MKIRPTEYQVQVKIFEMAGCVYVRTKGDHLIYHCPGAIRPVIIPEIQRSAGVYYTKQHAYNRDEQRAVL